MLGQAGAPGVDVLSIIRKYQLPEDFPTEVLREADKLPEQVRKQIQSRRDLRHIKMVTIDGADARIWMMRFP